MRVSPATAKFKGQQQPQPIPETHPAPRNALNLPGSSSPTSSASSASSMSSLTTTGSATSTASSEIKTPQEIKSPYAPHGTPTPPSKNPHNSVTAHIARGRSPGSLNDADIWRQSYVNSEQQAVNDDYNTTVFVGGLSPLISQETLQSYFEPFGPIHYVRLPPLMALIEDSTDLMVRSRCRRASSAASFSLCSSRMPRKLSIR